EDQADRAVSTGSYSLMVSSLPPVNAQTARPMAKPTPIRPITLTLHRNFVFGHRVDVFLAVGCVVFRFLLRGVFVVGVPVDSALQPWLA
ncbi:MAG TPA: hypothetical protein VGM75_16180, partial [Pseudonocardiaceae bacterium]